MVQSGGRRGKWCNEVTFLCQYSHRFRSGEINIIILSLPAANFVSREKNKATTDGKTYISYDRENFLLASKKAILDSSSTPTSYLQVGSIWLVSWGSTTSQTNLISDFANKFAQIFSLCQLVPSCREKEFA